jgi:hypothetical protein
MRFGYDRYNGIVFSYPRTMYTNSERMSLWLFTVHDLPLRQLYFIQEKIPRLVWELQGRT